MLCRYMAPEPGNELPPGENRSPELIRSLFRAMSSSTSSRHGFHSNTTAGEEVHDGIRAALKKHAPDVTAEPLDRFAFYARADTAFAIVQCVGERVRIDHSFPLPCGCHFTRTVGLVLSSG